MLTPASLRCWQSLGRGRGFLLLQTCRVTGTQNRTIAGAAAGVAEGEKKLKTFDDLPGPSLLNNIYWVFLRGYLLYSHDLQIIFKKKYGPMWKTSMGLQKTVNVADVDLVETILRQEGKYPMRNDMDLWKVHRHMRDLAYGPFTEEGHRWHTLRKVLNKRMLLPQEAVLYAGSVNEVVTDFLLRLDEMRKESPSGVMVNDLPNALYRFAFEGISYILFETRIGCLKNQIPAETQNFINSIADMMKYNIIVFLLPRWTKDILPFFKYYIESWDNIFNFAKKLIDQKMQTIQDRLDRAEEVKGEYLTYLLSSGEITPKEVYGSVAELLLAGVDTTSNTLSWALYHLSQNPGIQEELYKEVTGIVSGETIPTAQDISKMPLLKAVIKETLRMYPVVPTNTRIAVENDITLGDFYFPKGTLFALAHYLIAREEANFPDPNKFIPQRWFRDERVKNNPFSSIPFGYGVRACVGRRIAELEMHLALSRIMQKYEVKPDPQGGNIRAMARLVLAPNKPINLQFLKRMPLSSS
ncbi:sterol 26-hydroxylase, mitochondrial-like [Pelobates cultripes]|uniref:Sterol 26-hydroxylase, mitochondrial-like n=1 Tax=Pelobates cultripes TaxID=61616 RepID=A0AAD1SPP9_PELCU|nr:sterol 26-hydroxylase, mitochondrial-like [Pelobates cultripes]